MNTQTQLFSPVRSEPLALRMRPKSFDDYVGQENVLREIKHLGHALPHLILWGPPGTGKTTLAHLVAHETSSEIHPFNAVMSGVPELKKLIAMILDNQAVSQKKSILFIDEIHRFNKSQQDALLPYLERGDFHFIGATTEYPQTSLNRALLSRVRVMQLKSLVSQEIVHILARAISELARPELLEHASEIAKFCDGDARKALNLLSLLAQESKEKLEDHEHLKSLLQQQRAYDKNQDRHYDVISAFIKSVRGSDPDAALLWLAVMLDGGEDPEFIARRLMILASEDVGLANSQALQVCCNAHYVTKNIGMPEARITLAHATVFLTLSPKSNASYLAIDEALAFVKENPTLPVPDHLCSVGAGKKHYQYPHSFPKHWVAQSYRPPEAALMRFYRPGSLGSEAAMNEIWKKSTQT